MTLARKVGIQHPAVKGFNGWKGLSEGMRQTIPLRGWQCIAKHADMPGQRRDHPPDARINNGYRRADLNMWWIPARLMQNPAECAPAHHGEPATAKRRQRASLKA